MKIFKNRGDIYISKSNYKSSKEERILLILLGVVIVVTIIFFVVLGTKYSSVLEFFADGMVTTTEVSDSESSVLPEISGKTNFLILETDKNKTTIHYIFLVQADKDNKAYKACTLSPNMDIDGTSILKLYTDGGGASLQTKLTAYLGIDIDYYAAFDHDSFIEFINKMGTFTYQSPEAIKYDYDENEDDMYSVRIKEGEEKITANDLSELLRYYSNDGKNYYQSNQVILNALIGLFNEENYEDNQALFRLFISSASTNITVRNFQDNIDSLEVFCKTNNEIVVYNANADFDENNVISQQSVKEIKGYFTE